MDHKKKCGLKYDRILPTGAFAYENIKSSIDLYYNILIDCLNIAKSSGRHRVIAINTERRMIHVENLIFLYSFVPPRQIRNKKIVPI